MYLLVWRTKNRKLFAVVNGDEIRWSPSRKQGTTLPYQKAARWRKRLTGGDIYIKRKNEKEHHDCLDYYETMA